jgi:hypothetical protein
MLLFISVLLVLVVLLVSPLIVGMVLLARKHARVGCIILGVYTMLIAFFLIHAQFEKRSTSGHILRRLKGEGGIRQDMNDLAEDAKKVVNPLELQQWAVTILHETQQTNTEFQIPADKVPANIRSLTSDEVPFGDAEYEGKGILAPDPCIMLYWGGPMGHWGLCVGSQTFKIQSMLNADYIEWKPGVYFWCETR